jgi:hypothetical protein
MPTLVSNPFQMSLLDRDLPGLMPGGAGVPVLPCGFIVTKEML